LAHEIIASDNNCLLSFEIFLLSSIPSGISFGFRITVAAVTGPAQDPRPTSSVPAISYLPLLINSCSNKKFGLKPLSSLFSFDCKNIFFYANCNYGFKVFFTFTFFLSSFQVQLRRHVL
jgi:hypothetical protein